MIQAAAYFKISSCPLFFNKLAFVNKLISSSNFFSDELEKPIA